MSSVRLQLGLRQQLRMAPQLQQAFGLLQLNRMQLSEYLREIIDANPLLEMADEGDLDAELDATTPPAAGAAAEVAQSPPAAAEADAEAWPDNDHWDSPAHGVYGDDPDRELAAGDEPGTTTLAAHLLEQLNLEALDDTRTAIGRALIFALDDDGYLHDSFDELRQALAPEYLVSTAQIEEVLAIVQQFEPAGIAARSPAECLLLQIRQCRAAPEIKRLAARIVSDHLEDLAHAHWVRLERRLACSAGEMALAVDLIRSLNPHPGGAYDNERTEYVQPDVYVRKIAGEWQIRLSAEHQPNLRLNDYYLGLMARARGDEARYLQSRAQEARWLISALELRNQTLYKVAATIVEHQTSFFEEGEHALRPLVMRQIAAVTGVHESTVSRAVAGKFLASPRGILPLRYFFSARLDSEDGEGVASQAIRARIRDLIAGEDPARPLSDLAICRALATAGFQVARRTVAKYRLQLNILDSRSRRRRPPPAPNR